MNSPPLDFTVLSRVFREGLLAYDLMPNEFRLAQLLCLDSYDAGQAVACVRLLDWAGWLGLRDSKGVRRDKCAVLLETLNSLGLVHVNAAQGTFEPRPDASLWSRARALRARASSASIDGRSAELPLRTEPLLEEALSELARDRASAQSPMPRVGGEIRRPESAEKSAAGLLPVQRSTFNRLNVETIKRVTLDHASEKSAASTKEVWQRVREFVGERDFREHWEKAGYVWSNPERVAVLAGALAYVAAGVKSGEMMIKTTRGAALWSQAQIDWRKHQAEVMA